MPYLNKYSIWSPCPKCAGDLEIYAHALICESCGEVYPDDDCDDVMNMTDEEYKKYKNLKTMNS